MQRSLVWLMGEKTLRCMDLNWTATVLKELDEKLPEPIALRSLDTSQGASIASDAETGWFPQPWLDLHTLRVVGKVMQAQHLAKTERLAMSGSLKAQCVELYEHWEKVSPRIRVHMRAMTGSHQQQQHARSAWDKIQEVATLRLKVAKACGSTNVNVVAEATAALVRALEESHWDNIYNAIVDFESDDDGRSSTFAAFLSAFSDGAHTGEDDLGDSAGANPAAVAKDLAHAVLRSIAFVLAEVGYAKDKLADLFSSEGPATLDMDAEAKAKDGQIFDWLSVALGLAGQFFTDDGVIHLALNAARFAIVVRDDVLQVCTDTEGSRPNHEEPRAVFGKWCKAWSARRELSQELELTRARREGKGPLDDQRSALQAFSDSVLCAPMRDRLIEWFEKQVGDLDEKTVASLTADALNKQDSLPSELKTLASAASCMARLSDVAKGLREGKALNIVDLSKLLHNAALARDASSRIMGASPGEAEQTILAQWKEEFQSLQSRLDGGVKNASDFCAKFADLKQSVDDWDFSGFPSIVSGISSPQDQALSQATKLAIEEWPTRRNIVASLFGNLGFADVEDSGYIATMVSNKEDHEQLFKLASQTMAAGVLVNKLFACAKEKDLQKVLAMVKSSLRLQFDDLWPNLKKRLSDALQGPGGVVAAGSDAQSPLAAKDNDAPKRATLQRLKKTSAASGG